MTLRGFMQGPHLRLGVLQLSENHAGPGISLVRIEIAAQDYHQIDVLADIPLAVESVRRGALDSVTDCLAQMELAGGLALLREECPQVGNHPVFEPLNLRFGEGDKLGPSNR